MKLENEQLGLIDFLPFLTIQGLCFYLMIQQSQSLKSKMLNLCEFLIVFLHPIGPFIFRTINFNCFEKVKGHYTAKLQRTVQSENTFSVSKDKLKRTSCDEQYFKLG